MNKEEIIEYCLTLKDTYKDCPFSEDYETVVMKHCENNKWFALIKMVNNKLYLNIKTDPCYSELLRKSYNYIIPGFHMNKQHWNSIVVDDCTDFDLLIELIKESYDLTKKEVMYSKKISNINGRYMIM